MSTRTVAGVVAAVALAATASGQGWGPWEVTESDEYRLAVGCSLSDATGNWACISVSAGPEVEIYSDRTDGLRSVSVSIDGGEIFVDTDPGPDAAEWFGPRADLLIDELISGELAFVVLDYVDRPDPAFEVDLAGADDAIAGVIQ